MMWMCIAVFLLWMKSGGCTEKANTSDLMEYTAADFYEKLHSGKMMFIYFEHQVTPTISLFLVELEKGGKEFLGFDLDTVFDVNSIVSEVLFAILREEVKYVHTDSDLLAMEKAARGKKDIVLGYVRSLGTQEHRSLMETAYVYGSKYQFILITGGPLSHSSRVWFLHCRVDSGFVTPMTCPLTLMRKPLSTLSLHSFLQLMEAPLVSEVYSDPSSVQPPQFPYQQTPQSLEVKYLTMNDLDEVLELFTNQEKEEEDEEEDEEESDGNLDDEIAASVYENRGNMPDMDSITQLTSDNFHTAVAQSSLTVALFYLKYSEVQMSAVDCGEWTDLCAAQPGSSLPIPFRPITAFPSVLLLRPHESAQYYRGMLGTEALHRFIMLSHPASPVLLSTQEEVTSFLQEVPHPELAGYTPDRVLGLAAEHAVDLPAVLVFPSWRTHTHPSTLPVSHSAEELLSHINTALLHPLPELTVENLPSVLSLGKALLLLFVGEEEDEFGRKQNQALVEEMRGVVELGGRRMEPYQACWIHLGRTPAGMSVLGSYLGSMPPLPALVLTHLPSGGEIYQYPPNMPIGAPSVLQWLQRIEDGTESAAGLLGEDSWPPSVKFYDFLKIMDMQEPISAQQQTPEEEEEGEADEKEVNMEEDVLEEATYSSSSSPTPNKNPHSEL
ncbi:hypothetical protein FQN60_006629 [Etheostoma spectabile]|uniref:Thioredoxin domain-containing protein n=1 Tax=Etheostoma spectabile TaxID=54343 RepID=A0A5J5CG43_9PERO|nr:hypothetical protein FQN60_006629 [Etheostoma spectabile]